MKYKPVLIILILLVVVLGTIFWLRHNNNSNNVPAEFGSWYPAQNENGDPAIVDFENHIPCTTIDNQPIKNCNRMKFGIVFYQNPQTKTPTTYIMSRVQVGVSSERLVNKGTWTVSHGTGLDPSATIYKLDSNAPEEFRNFWLTSDDILFILNQDMKPRLGDAAYGYALNRVPLGQIYKVPTKN